MAKLDKEYRLSGGLCTCSYIPDSASTRDKRLYKERIACPCPKEYKTKGGGNVKRFRNSLAKLWK